MATYFIQIKSNWAGDRWQLVDGPFATRRDAERVKCIYEWHPRKPNGGIDIVAEIHARVVSKTQAGITKRNYAEKIEEMWLNREDPSQPWNQIEIKRR
ncbi:MAG: hypothetical protein JRJ29_00430 [Deltaproteobacteria bacterium]|nr:hypothetical protein [Deltaproteobacteria bacterium]MBW2081634.1 hypothetical protein [Deltaproteobacteria bacterium]